MKWHWHYLVRMEEIWETLKKRSSKANLKLSISFSPIWMNKYWSWMTKHQWNFESFHNDNCPISEKNISNFLHPDNVSFFFFLETVKLNSEVWISMFMIIVESVIERMPDRFKIYIQFLQLKCYTGYTGCIWVPLSWIGFEMPRRTE